MQQPVADPAATPESTVALHVIVAPSGVGRHTFARSLLATYHPSLELGACLVDNTEAGLSVHRCAKAAVARLRESGVAIVVGGVEAAPARAAIVQAARDVFKERCIAVAWYLDGYPAPGPGRVGVSPSEFREVIAGCTLGEALDHPPPPAGVVLATAGAQSLTSAPHVAVPTLREGFNVMRRMPFVVIDSPDAAALACEALIIDYSDCVVPPHGSATVVDQKRAAVEAWLNATAVGETRKDELEGAHLIALPPRLVVVTHLSGESASSAVIAMSRSVAVSQVARSLHGTRGGFGAALVLWQGVVSAASELVPCPMSPPALFGLLWRAVGVRPDSITVVCDALGVREEFQRGSYSAAFDGSALPRALSWSDFGKAVQTSPEISFECADASRQALARSFARGARASRWIRHRTQLDAAFVCALESVAPVPTGIVRNGLERSQSGMLRSGALSTSSRPDGEGAAAPQLDVRGAVGTPPPMTANDMPAHLMERKRVRPGTAAANATSEVVERPAKLKSGDPDAPKRPPTAFFIFSAQHRTAVAAQSPGEKVNVSAIATKLGAMWAALTPAERLPYDEEYQRLKEAYKRAVEEYVSSGKAAAFEARQQQAQQDAAASAAAVAKKKSTAAAATHTKAEDTRRVPVGTVLVEEAGGWARNARGQWVCEWDDDDDADRLPQAKATSRVVPKLGTLAPPGADPDDFATQMTRVNSGLRTRSRLDRGLTSGSSGATARGPADDDPFEGLASFGTPKLRRRSKRFD
jgi:hypothetical protein